MVDHGIDPDHVVLVVRLLMEGLTEPGNPTADDANTNDPDLRLQ